ncbi:uncharacterized protein DFL_008249 [Arthrobotrys flagrans]|uniref:Uncharacterized protein n=1 Tax=Arthrobotrys flagrans TaxID=97331 RepID=A0A436ZNH9_ARTFL|nr:hypothetical protein DFL_008249 [Arthrobotrys flagrans]
MDIITQGEAAAMRDWWAESRDFYYSASAQTIITCGIVEKYLKIQENQSVIRLHLPLSSIVETKSLLPSIC